jgi:hypothetical protein
MVELEELVAAAEVLEHRQLVVLRVLQALQVCPMV